jgi:hypothetical protein
MDYVFYADGDGQYDLREINKFISLIPFSDLVVGFRIKKQYKFFRMITSIVYNLIVRLLFKLPDRDVNCAFKLYPRILFDEIDLKSVHYFIDAEIAIQAKLLNYQTTQVGVTHLPRINGTSAAANPVSVFRVIKEIIGAYPKYRSLLKP